jgi:hypothetical protein
MFDRFSLKSLLWSLVGAAAIFVVIHQVWKADGFWLNLATESVGIVVTVWIVDGFVKRHHEQQWLAVERRVKQDIASLVSDIIFDLRRRLRIRIGLDSVIDDIVEESDLLTSMMKMANAWAKEDIRQQIWKLDVDEVRDLRRELLAMASRVERVFALYQPRLSAALQESLMDLREKLNLSAVRLDLFIDRIIERELAEKGPSSETEAWKTMWASGFAASVTSLVVTLNRTADLVA